MPGISAIYDHAEDIGYQNDCSIFTFPFFSLRKSFWLKSTSLHVKPSKTEGIIIVMGKDLKNKSLFYDSRKEESFILDPE